MQPLDRRIPDPYSTDEDAIQKAKEQLDALYKNAHVELGKEAAEQKKWRQIAADDLTHHLHARDQEMNRQAAILNQNLRVDEESVLQTTKRFHRDLERSDQVHQEKIKRAYQELDRLKAQKVSQPQTSNSLTPSYSSNSYGKGFGANFGKNLVDEEDT